MILDLAAVALTALLSENFIMVNCLAIGTREESYKNPVDAIRTGYCLTAVMVLSALISWLLDFFLFTRYGMAHLRLLTLSLLVPGMVAALRWFVRTCLPELSRRIDDNLSSIATNCAAMGSALLISQRSYGLGAALVFGLCGGVGATLALASFASLRGEVSFKHCPKCFQGTPIMLITAP